MTDTDVLVEGGLIARVGKDIEAAGATVIDGGGRTLMPGLIDMHSHFAIQEGMLTGRSDYDQMAMGARAAKDIHAIDRQNVVLVMKDGKFYKNTVVAYDDSSLIEWRSWGHQDGATWTFSLKS